MKFLKIVKTGASAPVFFYVLNQVFAAHTGEFGRFLDQLPKAGSYSPFADSATPATSLYIAT